MYFNHPEFLYGLLAVLIPVIIHLFNFRRYKKLWFSNIEFLKNITAQTRKQNKLKHLIVMLLRMLAVALIVLAFAGPELNRNRVPLATGGLTAVYVDNSFSMVAEGENGRLFDEAVASARELVNSSPRDKRFLLLTNNVRPSQRRVLTKEEMLNELDRLEISPAAGAMAGVVKNATSIAAEKKYPSFEMYLFSDFQKNNTDLPEMAKDTAVYLYMLPYRHLQKRNVYIDTCWLTAPVMIAGRKTELKVRLRNSSATDYEKIPLKLRVNGQQKAVAGVDVKAGGEELVTMSFTPRRTGWHSGLLEIEDYPITFDDNLYFTFRVEPYLNVLEIGTENNSDALALFYGSDSLFRYTKMDYRRVKYDELNRFNLIILNSLPAISNGLIQQLKTAVENGANMMFIPAASENKTDENLLLHEFGAGSVGVLVEGQSRVVGIKTTSPLFREAISKIPENADLPVVQHHYRFHYGISSGVESLVTLLDGDDFLLVKKTGKGHFYMLAAPLDKSFGNFARHALFVPVMYGAAVSGEAHTQLFRIIGKDDKVLLNDPDALPADDQPFTVKKQGGDYAFIPGQQVVNGSLLLNMHDGIKTDGIYNLLSGDKTIYELAYNYDRRESQLDFYTADELREIIDTEALSRMEVLSADEAGFSEMLNTVHKESQLWKLFIIFALLMLLSEVLILRYWK